MLALLRMEFLERNSRDTVLKSACTRILYAAYSIQCTNYAWWHDELSGCTNSSVLPPPPKKTPENSTARPRREICTVTRS